MDESALTAAVGLPTAGEAQPAVMPHEPKVEGATEGVDEKLPDSAAAKEETLISSHRFTNKKVQSAFSVRSMSFRKLLNPDRRVH